MMRGRTKKQKSTYSQRISSKMKIQFESTIDEVVDAQIRLFKKSKSAKRWKLQGLILAPLLFIGFYFGIPDEQNIKLIFAFLASIIFIAIYLGTYKKTIKKRTKKLIIEQLGTDNPIPSEYEFNEEALIFRKMGTEIKINWNSIKKINENDKDIEFLIDKGDIAIIPNRIFASAKQKEKWLKFAKSKTEFI